MRRPQGYLIVTEPGKATIERDSVTCAHCNSIVFIKPFQDPHLIGGFCFKCMRHICGPCTDGPCVPFEHALDLFEKGVARSLARRALWRAIE